VRSSSSRLCLANARGTTEVECPNSPCFEALVFKEPCVYRPPGKLATESRIHGFSFFLGSPHFGHTHANQTPFL
jgi:hypothetical protein